MTFFKVLSYPELDALVIRDGNILELLFEKNGRIVKTVKKFGSVEEAVSVFDRIDESYSEFNDLIKKEFEEETVYGYK